MILCYVFLCCDNFTETAKLSLTWPGITMAFVTAEIQKHSVNLELFSSQHFNKHDTLLITRELEHSLESADFVSCGHWKIHFSSCWTLFDIPTFTSSLYFTCQMFHMYLTTHTTLKANKQQRPKTFYAILAQSNERNVNARRGQKE